MKLETENAFGETEFSSNIATLYRIDICLRRCAEYSSQRKYVEWYRQLVVLKREAIVKMRKRVDHKDCSLNFTEKNYCHLCHCMKIYEDLSKLMMLYEHSKHKNDLNSYVENQLDKAEIFVRNFMDMKGMLLRDSKDIMTKMFSNG